MALFTDVPLFAWTWWRALSAIERKDWEVAARHLRAIHARGLGDDDSHYRCGQAYVMLKRWNDAITEFREIGGELPSISTQAHYIFNYSLALAHVGQLEDAREMLAACTAMTWPSHLRRPIEQLNEYLRQERDQPPSPAH